jgi:hypothetical protein
MNSSHEEFDARDGGYEYCQFAATPVDELMRRLAEEARDGWELVCVTVEEPYYRAFLKRPAREAG